MRFNLVEGGRGGLNAVLRWKENFQIRVCRGRQSWLGRLSRITLVFHLFWATKRWVVKLKVVANCTLVFSRGTMLRKERTVTKCKI